MLLGQAVLFAYKSAKINDISREWMSWSTEEARLEPQQ